MDLGFRPIDYTSDDDCRLLVKWNSDESIRHLVRPRRNPKVPVIPETLSALRERNLSRPKTARDWMILDDGRPIGECSLLIDPPHRLTKVGCVAWFGILIGNQEYRGRGVGKCAFSYMEERALELGADRAEVGVFEFNEASIRLMKASGYHPIGRIENFTFWDDKFWADLRFLKMLK